MRTSIGSGTDILCHNPVNLGRCLPAGLAGDADSHVIVRAGREHPRPGETVKVKVDTAHLHLFDAGTGRRVGE